MSFEPLVIIQDYDPESNYSRSTLNEHVNLGYKILSVVPNSPVTVHSVDPTSGFSYTKTTQFYTVMLVLN